jgi:hypothetical protein
MARFAQDSAMLILCTRWHIDDLIGRYLRKDKHLRQIQFPAIAEKDEPNRRKGEPLFPALKSKSFLMERKALMTESSWAAEYHMFLIEKLRHASHEIRYARCAWALACIGARGNHQAVG